MSRTSAQLDRTNGHNVAGGYSSLVVRALVLSSSILLIGEPGDCSV